ncbi:hypothetical protein [Vulcanisaeta thermophila]|uniref:hypothetical protein n=1 Tax=Vulcanisaeta thermophila TaxID=867917 RepID=UPI0009FE05BB|nr:hypothetical protein [Vulcanisaeta thermophila]
MGECVVYIDKREFVIGEPVYAVLVNNGARPLHLGSWQIIDERANIIFTVEPPQLLIPPGTSYGIVWFQINDKGEQVRGGRYRIMWRPRVDSQVIECVSDYFIIIP